MVDEVALVRDESHINFRTHWVIITQRTWLPPLLPPPRPPSLPPAICVTSRFSAKSIVFQKIFWLSLGYKRANCIFEELSNLYLIALLISFFPLILWITVENRTKLKKHKNCAWLFISNCNNAIVVLDWTLLLHYFWLQEFIQQ